MIPRQARESLGRAWCALLEEKTGVPHQIVPNPGSEEARAQGCLCPVIDNGRGEGMMGGEAKHPVSGLPVFTINLLCPLHGNSDWLDLEET